jgi:hypothetical protein
LSCALGTQGRDFGPYLEDHKLGAPILAGNTVFTTMACRISRRNMNALGITKNILWEYLRKIFIASSKKTFLTKGKRGNTYITPDLPLHQVHTAIGKADLKAI